MYLYHATKSTLRPFILKEGLCGHKIPSLWDNFRTDEDKGVQPLGNYGFEDIGQAIAYESSLRSSCLISNKEKIDIWQIDTTGLVVLYDPERYLEDPVSREDFVAGRTSDDVQACYDGTCGHYLFETRWYTPQWVCPDKLVLVPDPQALAKKQKTTPKICELRERVKPFPVWSF